MADKIFVFILLSLAIFSTPVYSGPANFTTCKLLLIIFSYLSFFNYYFLFSGDGEIGKTFHSRDIKVDVSDCVQKDRCPLSIGSVYNFTVRFGKCINL